MDNKSDEKFFIMQDLMDKRDSDFTDMKSDMKKIDSDFTKMNSGINKIKKMSTDMTSQKHISSPVNMDSPKYQDPDTVVSTNKKYPPLEGGNSTKHCDMWTLKHEISSPKFYELLVKTEIKGDTSMYLKSL